MTTSPEPILVAAVGGIDPTGGSGIGRDAATLASVGVTPIVISAAATFQDARGVAQVFAVDPPIVAEQLRIALASGARAVKTGMLWSAATANEIARVLATRPVPLVFDPVFRASSGGTLADAGLAAGLDALRPVAHVITPNLEEARTILGVRDLEAQEAAAALVARGWRAALVTGGDDDAIDHLARRDAEPVALQGVHVPGSVRGTGCALASLIAAGLARGFDLEEACRAAKGRVTRAIRNSSGGYLALQGEPAWSLAGHPFE